MKRKYRNLDARTLDLRTGKKQFLFRTAIDLPPEDEDDIGEALNTPENVKSDELDYLEQLEYRQLSGEDLTDADLEALHNLSMKYQDMLSRTVSTPFTEDPRELPEEGVPSLPEEEGARVREQVKNIESDRAQKREVVDAEKNEFRQLLLKDMRGDTLSEEENAKVAEFRKKYPGIMQPMTNRDVAMVGMHRPEESLGAPTPDEFTQQLGHPFESILVGKPLLDTDGEIQIDPEVASEDEKFGKDYGTVKYIPDFLKSEEHLQDYRSWLESLPVDPTLVETNPLVATAAPKWYSIGLKDKSHTDITDRTNDIVDVLKRVNNLSPDDVKVYGEMFNNILKEWPKYGPNINSQVIPQFQEILKTKFDIDAADASDISMDILGALTQEMPMDTRRVLEKADIIEQRLKRGEPVTQKDRALEYRRVQKIIDAIGQPLDLMGAASWLEHIQEDGRWRKKVMRGTTEEGVNYTIDPPEALVTAYRFIAQSPLPDKVKENAANILMTNKPYETFREKGRGKIGYSKLEQVMNMLSEYTLGQHKLYNPDRVQNRKDLYKLDQRQRNEQQRLLKTHDELITSLQHTFGLSHGDALDYIRNTVNGQQLWKTVMNEKVGPAIKDVRDRYEKEPSAEARTFLGQFEYGLPEAFLILSGTPKNRAKYPNIPFTELQGPEVDNRVLESLQTLWLDPSDKYGRDKLKKLFPGTMQVPVVETGNPEKGEDPNRQYLKTRTRPRADVSLLQDPAVMAGIAELVKRKRTQEEGAMTYMGMERGPSKRKNKAPFASHTLNLKKNAFNLSLYTPSLHIKKRAESAEDLLNILSGYTEALGKGAPLSELRRLFDKKLIQREKDEERRADLDHLFNIMRSGVTERGGIEWTIPQDARKDARAIYFDGNLSVTEKYEKINNLLRNQLNVPEDKTALQNYLTGNTIEPPLLEYSGPVPNKIKDYIDSVSDALDKGTPLTEQPDTFKNPQPQVPVEYPSSLRKQPLPDANTLEKPVESRPIELPVTSEPTQKPVIDLEAMEETIRGGDAPESGAVTQTRDDIFEPPTATPFKSIQPKQTGETHAADSLAFGETFGEGWIKTPIDMRTPEGAFIKTFPGKDYNLVRPPDDTMTQRLLEDISNFILQEQGFEVLEDTDIVDNVNDAPFEEEDLSKGGALSLRRKRCKSLNLLKFTDAMEETESITPTPEEQPQKVDPQEYIGVTDEGLQKLDELQDASPEERVPYPGLFESLDFLAQFNRVADSVGYQPIRSKEELIKWFAKAGLSEDAFWYAAGKNPSGTRYISWFQDRPGEFTPVHESEKNLVQDRQHYIRNLFSRNPLSEHQLSKLTDTEREFLDNLRTSNNTARPVNIQDIQNQLIRMIKNFQKLEPPGPELKNDLYPSKYFQYLQEKQRTRPEEITHEEMLFLERGGHFSENPEITKDPRIIEQIQQEEIADYNRKYTDALHAYEILDMFNKGELQTKMDDTDKTFLRRIREDLEAVRNKQTKRPFNAQTARKLYEIAYPPKDEPELWKTPESEMARNIIKQIDVPDPASADAVRFEKDPRKLPFFFNKGEPFPTAFWEEREKWMPAKKKWTQEFNSFIKNPFKKMSRLWLGETADTSGPGGPDWTYEFTSGPTPTKDEKERRKHRFPFYNKPSKDLALDGGDQGNIINSKPGVQNMDNIEATINGITKIADNELFEVHSCGDDSGPWIAATVFKKAYSKFKEGDIVIQYGKQSSEIHTLRRRFGTKKEATRNLPEALEPVYAILSNELNFKLGDPTQIPKISYYWTDDHPKPKQRIIDSNNNVEANDIPKTHFGNSSSLKKQSVNIPGTSTPNDTFHDIQTGPSSGGGPYKKRVDYDAPEGGPREGFKRKKPRRKQDTERNVFPYEDQQVSNQTSIFGTEKQGEVGNYSAPIVETPEERAGKPEQDIPKAINYDPKRPFPSKRKRTDYNESQLLDIPTFQRHDIPKQNI